MAVAIIHRNRVTTFKALKTSDNSVVVLKMIEDCDQYGAFPLAMEQLKVYESPFLVRYLDNDEDNRGCQVRTREMCQRLGCDGVL